MMKQLSLCILIGFFFTGCATTPNFDTHQVDYLLTPKTAVSDISSTHGKTAMWGGIILSGKNFKDHTQLEILAYPVDKEGIPYPKGKPMGRFLAQKQGYLETSEYSEGRYITVIGAVKSLDEGKVGETNYQYPVLAIQQLHLWPKDGPRDTQSRFHFGIGVIFH